MERNTLRSNYLELLNSTFEDHHAIFRSLLEIKHLYSEFVFYLRFFAQEKEKNFFYLPTTGSEDWEVLICYYQDSATTMKECWKAWMQSKLFLMTSCSHFANTFTEKIFSPHKIRKQSDTTCNIKEKIKRMILKGKKDFYIRLESENHVMLIDFPRSITKQGNGVILQSRLRIADSLYEIHSLEKLEEMITTWEVIFVAEYDVETVKNKLAEELKNCFGRLGDAIDYCDHKKPWFEILNFVDSINDAVNKADSLDMKGDLWSEHLADQFL